MSDPESGNPGEKVRVSVVLDNSLTWSSGGVSGLKVNTFWGGDSKI